MQYLIAYLIGIGAVAPIVVSSIAGPISQYEEMQQKRTQTICMAASPTLCR